MLPQDPFILFSYVNTQLRDHFSSLEAFCSDVSITVQDITSKLEAVGFHYDHQLNQFR